MLVSLLCHCPAHVQHEEETSKPYFSSVQPSLTFKGLTGSWFLLIYSQLQVYNTIAKGKRQNIHTHTHTHTKKRQARFVYSKKKQPLLSYPTVSVLFCTPLFSHRCTAPQAEQFHQRHVQIHGGPIGVGVGISRTQ